MITLNVLLADCRFYPLDLSLASQLSDTSHARLQLINSPVRQVQFLLGRQLMAQAAHCALNEIHEGAHFPYYPAYPSWQASISHSGDFIALVFSENGRFGLDIEHPTRERNCLALAERAFAKEETQWIAEGDAEEQKARFHQVWTLREAAFKAGLIPNVVSQQCVFDPQIEKALAPIYAQHQIQQGIYITVAGAQAFEVQVQLQLIPRP